MIDSKFRVRLESWSGHGEGGCIATVSLDKDYGLHNSTAEQVDAASADVDELNAMLDVLQKQCDVDDLQAKLYAWSSDTFGDATVRGPEGPLNHLRKEIDEVIADPSDVVEFADMYMLVSDAASRAGHKMSDVIRASVDKLAVCETRDWGPVNDQGFSEHIRNTD